MTTENVEVKESDDGMAIPSHDYDTAEFACFKPTDNRFASRAEAAIVTAREVAVLLLFGSIVVV